MAEKGYYEEWKCKDGRVLRVCDMSDDHVRNILNMILRKRRQRQELKRDLKALQEWSDEFMEDDKTWGSRK